MAMGSRILRGAFAALFLCALFAVIYLVWGAFWRLVFILTDLAGGGLISFLWALAISASLVAGLYRMNEVRKNRRAEAMRNLDIGEKP
jgi:hypothetical protein